MPAFSKENQPSNGGALHTSPNCLDILLLHQSRQCASDANTASLSSSLTASSQHPLSSLCQALDKALEICGGVSDEALLAMTRHPAPPVESSSSSLTVRDPPMEQ